MKEFLQAIVVGGLLPTLLLGFVMLNSQRASEDEFSLPRETWMEETSPAHLPDPTQPGASGRRISVLLEGKRCEMELEEYIVGVVLGEMPTDFEPEALKAQAVVARTYTLKTCMKQKRHNGAVCTTSSCCQAYRDPTSYVEKGGSEKGLQRVRRAVEETRGQVLTYGGRLIDATYFSCSGGSTEDAAAVWGYDVPYLQAVDSPGEEDASVYEKTVTFTASEFQKKLAVRLSGDPKGWFGKVVHTDGGGVATMEIGGVVYRGTTLRSLLKLRSTNFTVKVTGETITIYTKGYGHRVGMSQYGADAMAVTGSSYLQILSHYYRGTTLTVIEDV